MNAFTPVTAALPGSGAPTRPPPSAHRLQRLPRRCRCRHRHRMTTPTPRHPSRCLACTPCTAPSRTARSHAPSRPGSREVGGGRCSSASRRSPGRAASSARCSAGYASGREPVARKSKRRAESPACGGRWLLGGCWRLAVGAHRLAVGVHPAAGVLSAIPCHGELPLENGAVKNAAVTEPKASRRTQREAHQNSPPVSTTHGSRPQLQLPGRAASSGGACSLSS